MSRRYLLFGVSLFVLPAYAQASLCEQVPDCAALGFTTGYEDGCAENGYLVCPFDSNYRKCVTHSCTEQGFTTDDKSEWCDNIITCESDSSYTACVAEKQCPQSNIELAANCGDGTGGALGWTMGDSTFDKNRYPLECVAKECPEGSDTSRKHRLEGISLVVTVGYTGDTACTQLETCPEGSAYSSAHLMDDVETLGSTVVGSIRSGLVMTDRQNCYEVECLQNVASVADCGTTGSEGWKVTRSLLGSCNYCVAKACPDGSRTGSFGDCYQHEITGYSGNRMCYSETKGIYCPYDCSNVNLGGGRYCAACSQSSTCGGEMCMRCKNVSLPDDILPVEP